MVVCLQVCVSTTTTNIAAIFRSLNKICVHCSQSFYCNLPSVMKSILGTMFYGLICGIGDMHLARLTGRFLNGKEPESERKKNSFVSGVGRGRKGKGQIKRKRENEERRTGES